MNRRTLAVGLAAATLLAGCSGSQDGGPAGDSTPAPDATVGVDPALAEFYTQTLQWSGCGGDFQCTTLTVPLDYSAPDDSAPDDDTIEIAVLRSPATGDDPQGSLLVNPGGPGASGVDYARAARSLASEPVLDAYDIVGFDPRGVGNSEPIDCLDDDALDDYINTDGSPDTAAEVNAYQEQAAAFASGCEQRSGDLLPHMGTSDVARDMDILRAALGDEALTYLGKSYGTYLGAVYADLFPSRVGRLVLDGAIDPTLSSTEMALGQAAGFERALSAFITWCLDNGCSIGSTEKEVRDALADFFDEVDAEPLPTGDDNRPLTESLAFYGVILPLYLPADEGFPMLDRALDAAINDNDGSELLTLADLYLDRSSSGEYNGNMNEAFVAVSCLDNPESSTPTEVEASLPAFESASPIFGEFFAWSGLSCGDWPVQGSSQPTDPVTAAGADPILVVGTTGDPATPYEWAQALADQLESGVLLSYEGSVHTAYQSGSECVDRAVDAYLLNGIVPEEGLLCS